MPPSGLEENAFFSNFCINYGIYTIYIQWALNTGPTSHATVLAFWINLVWVGNHHERQNRPDRLWAAVSGLLKLVFFPTSS